MGSKRSAALPNLPTLDESGINNAGVDNWLAIIGPAGIPADVVAKLNTEIVAVLSQTKTRKRLTGLGLETVASTPAHCVKVLEDDIISWGATSD